jgi:hypothetical protein
MILPKITNFVNEMKQSTPINTFGWKEFELVKLFSDYDRGQRLKRSDRIDGDLPLVTAGQFNNGIAQCVQKNNSNKIFENCITIDMFGNCFYQEGKYVCDDNVISIKNIKNKFVGLFLASVFNKSINFDFKKQFRIKQLVNVKIKLPIDRNNEPDWKYMEDYMKNLVKEIKGSLVG